MILWEILIPSTMHGLVVKKNHHRIWDAYVRSLSGGLTVLKTVHGQWIDSQSKSLSEEKMIPVRVACSERDIRKIIQFTLDHYQQRAVMAYQLSDKVLLIEAK